MTYPLYGAMDSIFRFPGEVNVAVPPSQFTPDQPGVLVSYDAEPRHLGLIIGNPFLGSTDAGVLLYAFRADRDGFTGRWTNGGLRLSAGQRGKPTIAQGHFCATRIRN
jgi:hypothetical protein